MNNTEYYMINIDLLLKNLKSNSKTGLSKIDVENRIKKFGKNKLNNINKISAFKVFISQFKSSIIYILLFAVIISIILGEWVDAIVIIIILILNATLGFFQEYNAEKSIAELKKLSSFKSLVLRDSLKTKINSEDLVPGDIIFVEEGNKISADCRIIESVNLKIDESSLTGESVSVDKEDCIIKDECVISDQKNMLFSGTLVTSGTAKAIVVKTGMNSEIGKIADLITKIDKITPLQKKLDKLGKILATIVIIVCIIIFVTGIIKDGFYIYLISGQFIEFIKNSEIWLITAVSLAVAAVPEGLPAVVTVALSIGVKKMIKKNALIRNLASVETLGETNIICTDKTGTLTKNEMTVRKLYINLKEYNVDGTGYLLNGDILDPINKMKSTVNNYLFKIGILANNSNINVNSKDYKIIGDPTEIALLVSASKNKINFKQVQKNNPRSFEIPFSSKRKIMSSINLDQINNNNYIYTKGAPENILNICSKILINNKIVNLTEDIKKQILKKNKDFASSALRVLGFSYNKIKLDINKNYIKNNDLLLDFEKEQIFVGLQAMIDPPRNDIKESILKCKNAGIRVIMITGDNKYTASAIGKEIGIEGNTINGADFFKFNLKKQNRLVKNISIFSRVEPEHKLKIIKLLQKQGFTVSMSGDGVNDAPAIKQADLGIAMGITGTDVTKSVSDMILLDDKFNTIVNTIEEGRGIYENIKKFVNYLLSSNIAEVLIIFFAIIFGWPLPMTAIMLLWLNLVTDGFPALALSLDPNPKYLMKLKPKGKNENIVTKKLWLNIIIISILICCAVLYIFKINLIHGVKYARTLTFTLLVIIELVRPFDIRKDFKLGYFSNIYLIGAVILSLILQLIVIYTPINKIFDIVVLDIKSWILIVVTTIIIYFVNFIIQNVIFKKYFINKNINR